MFRQESSVAVRYDQSVTMPRPGEIRFVSRNASKFAEAEQILETAGVKLRPTKAEIEELQTKDIDRLVRDKVLKAYARIGHPLFVEHTGLALRHLNGFPGGLTQVFWDTLLADQFAYIFGELAPEKAATATTHIAYCDGARIFTFEGAINGTIVPKPRGDRTFQWDCVFQPEGSDQTFAEMGARKNDILSMDMLGEA